LLASRTEDPRGVLFASDAGPPKYRHPPESACGFYWTEGQRGLGWAYDAVPTLKGGSTIGIASPPAIWFPGTGLIATPDIRDAERLQGFPSGWTMSADEDPQRARTSRWKLVGNAVSVHVARWLGWQLTEPGSIAADTYPLESGSPWPAAAWGRRGQSWQVDVSMWPVRRRRLHLEEFLNHPVTPLSARATQGFLNRAEAGSLRFPPGFLDDVSAHLELMAGRANAA
jgi:DNA (cytosine-5)-methyltransferase 1